MQQSTTMEPSLKAAMLAQRRLRKFVDIFADEDMTTWDDVASLTNTELKQDMGMNLGARKALQKIIAEQPAGSNFTAATNCTAGAAVALLPPPASPASWQFEDGAAHSGDWKAYAASDQSGLESAYVAGGNLFTYAISGLQGTSPQQENTSTQAIRRMRRFPSQVPSAADRQRMGKELMETVKGKQWSKALSLVEKRAAVDCKDTGVVAFFLPKMPAYVSAEVRAEMEQEREIKGGTALIITSIFGRLALVEALLAAGADLKAACMDG